MKSQKGFTVLELIVVLAIVGILAGIVAPSWLGFLARQRQRVAAEHIKSLVEEVKSKAKLTKSDYLISFRRIGNSEWSYSFNSSTSNQLWIPLKFSSDIVLILPVEGFRISYKGTFYPSTVNSKVLVKSLNTTKTYCVEARTILGLVVLDEDSNCD